MNFRDLPFQKCFWVSTGQEYTRISPQSKRQMASSYITYHKEAQHPVDLFDFWGKYILYLGTLLQLYTGWHGKMPALSGATAGKSPAAHPGCNTNIPVNWATWLHRPCGIRCIYSGGNDPVWMLQRAPVGKPQFKPLGFGNMAMTSAVKLIYIRRNFSSHVIGSW